MPTGTITYDEGIESFQVEKSDASAPKRMKIQQRYLEKVGFTPSCIKCRAECRIRVEAEMMKHEDLRDELEKANNRINEYIATKVEENWKEKVRMAHEAPRSGDNEQVPPLDIDGNEIVPGERSSSSLGNALDVGRSAGSERARDDDIEDLDEPLAQPRLFEIDGPKREREQAESDEESAKRTRLNSEQSKPLNALRNCSGRKRMTKDVRHTMLWSSSHLPGDSSSKAKGTPWRLVSEQERC